LGRFCAEDIMAVSIRLRREGAKNRPFYRVIVADKRSPRDGKFIEVIGNYDPRKTGENYELNLDRAEYWVKNGAQPSETVASIIKKARKKNLVPAPVPAPAA
jgi:small subunit ribosomal protein S16